MLFGWLTDRLADARQPSFLFPFILFCFLLAVWPTSRPYSGDEIGAIVLSRGSVGQTIEAVAADVHPPLYFLLLKAVRAVGGERPGVLRLLSVAFAIGAFPLLWAVARRLFGRSVGVAAWLLATSSFVVFGSRFVSSYSLGLLETAAATYLLLLLLERPTRRRWIAYGAIVALSLYTFYLSVITIMAHAIVFVVAWRHEPRRFIPPLLVVAAVGLLFAPWIGVMGRQIDWIAASQATAGLVDRTAETAVQIAYTLYAFVASDSISPFALPFSLAVAVFYAILTVVGVRRVWQGRTARRHVILAMAALALAAPAVMRLIGLVPGPFIFVPVRLLFVAPFFTLIVACGILAIGDRRLRAAAFATAIAIQAFSLYNYYLNRQWTNWAYVVPGPEINAYVEQNAHANDLVIFDEWNLGRGPFFYWQGETAPSRFGPSAPQWPTRLNTARRVWVVRAVRDNSPGEQMEQLLLHLKLNFVLKDRQGYVKEPPALYVKKRRWLRREVFPHKIECLLFERVAAWRRPL